MRPQARSEANVLKSRDSFSSWMMSFAAGGPPNVFLQADLFHTDGAAGP